LIIFLSLCFSATFSRLGNFLEKRVALTDVFRNVGAITAGQVGSTSIMVDGDLETFDPHFVFSGTKGFNFQFKSL
jgi:hypothetical protein